MTTQTHAPVVLCPFWARFFQRGDGKWMAHCSSAACEQMEIDRPGWREFGEVLRSKHCGLGYVDGAADGSPAIVVSGMGTISSAARINGTASDWDYWLRGKGLRSDPRHVTDEQWSRYIDAFMDWQPPVGGAL